MGTNGVIFRPMPSVYFKETSDDDYAAKGDLLTTGEYITVSTSQYAPDYTCEHLVVPYPQKDEELTSSLARFANPGIPLTFEALALFNHHDPVQNDPRARRRELFEGLSDGTRQRRLEELRELMGRGSSLSADSSHDLSRYGSSQFESGSSSSGSEAVQAAQSIGSLSRRSGSITIGICKSLLEEVQAEQSHAEQSLAVEHSQEYHEQDDQSSISSQLISTSNGYNSVPASELFMLSTTTYQPNHNKVADDPCPSMNNPPSPQQWISRRNRYRRTGSSGLFGFGDAPRIHSEAHASIPQISDDRSAKQHSLHHSAQLKPVPEAQMIESPAGFCAHVIDKQAVHECRLFKGNVHVNVPCMCGSGPPSHRFHGSLFNYCKRNASIYHFYSPCNCILAEDPVPAPIPRLTTSSMSTAIDHSVPSKVVKGQTVGEVAKAMRDAYIGTLLGGKLEKLAISKPKKDKRGLFRFRKTTNASDTHGRHDRRGGVGGPPVVGGKPVFVERGYGVGGLGNVFGSLSLL